MKMTVSSPATDNLVIANGLRRFTLTTQHITLLRAAYVGWQDCETGAPEIDPKRPYGNSSVDYDVADLLGVPMDINHGNGDEEMSGGLRERMLAIHRETATALQVVLATGTFTPGVYEVEAYSRDWKLVAIE